MFSIFAKEPMRLGRDKHLGRVSSIIRGQQIAEKLGAKLNPTEGYENDVCIYIKPHVPDGFEWKFEGKPYLDMIDGWGLIPLMRKHPEVPIIMCSQQDMKIIANVLPNKLILIPQHHCNFERLERKSTEILTVGMVGTINAYQYLPEALEGKLAERGINLVKLSRFYTRQDIIDFYMKIDVQLVWRPYRMRLSNPLKIVNASSFGIPTIAYEETVFDEVKECYYPANDVDGFIMQLDLLRASPTLYKQLSDKCIGKAEEYHIDKIAELYKQL
jgi:hypothetical protein